MPEKSVFKSKLLFQELLIFGLVQLLGLWTAFRLLPHAAFVEIKIATSLWEFVISFIFATLFIIIFLRFIKGGLFFKAVFIFTIFLGCQIILSTFIFGLISIVLAATLVLFLFVTPKVWLHNLAIVLGVSGIGAAFGLSLPFSAVLIILFLLSVYDYVAVYKTGHMIKMFGELLQRGAIFALILPTKFSGWASDLAKVKPGINFLFLGTGDLVLPLVLAVSALSYGLESALFTVCGTLIGIVVLHTLFISQKKRLPMPALPPLAMFSLLGFLVSLLIK